MHLSRRRFHSFMILSPVASLLLQTGLAHFQPSQPRAREVIRFLKMRLQPPNQPVLIWFLRTSIYI